LLSGATSGQFSQVNLPAVSGMRWDTNALYSNGTIGAYLIGDVTRDGFVDADDIDSLYRHFGTQAWYDLNNDGVVNQADVTYEVVTILHTGYGDATLDRKVNFIDFQVLLDHWQNTGAGWATGDFGGDGKVNFLDFQKLLDNWNPIGYEGSQVPEPATLSLLALGGLAMLRRRR
jgi:hypothetical protein